MLLIRVRGWVRPLSSCIPKIWAAEDKNFSQQMALNPPKWAEILINLFLLVQKRVRKLMGVAINRYPDYF